jgi:hypothetical protein
MWKLHEIYVQLEVFTVAELWIVVFQFMMPCSPADGYQRSIGTYYFQFLIFSCSPDKI